MNIEHRSVNDSEGELLAILDRDGGVIIEGILNDEALDEVRSDLFPYLDASATGTNDFWGFETKRVGALMARSPKCRELALHPLINSLCGEYLNPYSDGYQLHFTQAISIGPDEDPQVLHRDRGVWGGYLNRSIETQFSTIWAISDFTSTNGATQIVPGSHKWDKDRQPTENEIALATMPAGSIMIYNGSVLHGGGRNTTSNEYRLAVLLHYTLTWLRQEENQYLSCPPEIAKELSAELRALMGYTQGGPVLGFYSTPTGPGLGVEVAAPEKLFEQT
ncbi:MAG: phytanoyl-CoA dioxygenase family protein [Actinomycetota bacterium]|nr:phytanoyl-CoA dioxygenase family protein [Actinomycetota bacterium]